jgi:hypothetical protein
MWRWFLLFSSSSRTKTKSSPILGMVEKSKNNLCKFFSLFVKFVCEIDVRTTATSG